MSKKSGEVSKNILRWESNGEAQKFLEKLFKEKKIQQDDRPNYIRQQYQLFQKFSADVFRAHFNVTRQKLGIGCR